MCDFISWIERKGTFVYIDDATLEEGRTKRLLRESKDNDFLGHGAIRAVYDLEKNEKEEHELRDFWLTDQLPKVLQEKLKDFESLKKNFRLMITNHSQKDDLVYIVENSPEDDPKWNGLRAFCEKILVERSEKRIQEFLSKTTVEEFDPPLSVDYDESLAELIGKGTYKDVDLNIKEKNFPKDKNKKGKVKLNVKFVCINADAETYGTYEVEAVIARKNLRSGDVQELLEFGAAHPDEQLKYPAVALGSGWHDGGNVYVPYLWSDAIERYLYLGRRGLGWRSGFCFLAFSK